MLAGGGPAAAHFLCSAKESKQRKAAAVRSPLRGCPVVSGINREAKKIASLRQFSLLVRFFPDITGCSLAVFLSPRLRHCLVARLRLCFGLAFGFAFCSPLALLLFACDFAFGFVFVFGFVLCLFSVLFFLFLSAAFFLVCLFFFST